MSDREDNTVKSGHAAEGATLRLFAELHRESAAASADEVEVRDHHLDCVLQCEREAGFLDILAAARILPSTPRKGRLPTKDATPERPTCDEKKARHFAEVEALAKELGLSDDWHLPHFIGNANARHLALVRLIRGYVEGQRMKREAKRYWLLHPLKPPAPREWLRGPCEDCELLDNQ